MGPRLRRNAPSEHDDWYAMALFAERDDRRLHNFAAHVLRVRGERVTEWRMAEAKPAESHRFWA